MVRTVTVFPERNDSGFAFIRFERSEVHLLQLMRILQLYKSFLGSFALNVMESFNWNFLRKRFCIERSQQKKHFIEQNNYCVSTFYFNVLCPCTHLRAPQNVTEQKYVPGWNDWIILNQFFPVSSMRYVSFKKLPVMQVGWLINEKSAIVFKHSRTGLQMCIMQVIYFFHWSDGNCRWYEAIHNDLRLLRKLLHLNPRVTRSVKHWKFCGGQTFILANSALV